MRATRLYTAAAAAAAILLLAGGCQALTLEEAVQVSNTAFWKLYGPSLPDCKGDWFMVSSKLRCTEAKHAGSCMQLLHST